MAKLDKAEKELLKTYENDEWVSVRDVESQKSNYKEAAQYTMQKNKKIKERVSILEIVLGEFIVQSNKSLNRLEKEMKEFKDEMRLDRKAPEHQGKTVVPVFSSLSLPERTVAYLTEKNILAMAMGGETMKLLNFDALKEH